MSEHETTPEPEQSEQPISNDYSKLSESPMWRFNQGENQEGWKSQEPSDTLIAELADRQQMEDPETGQKFGFIDLNRDSEHPRPVISLVPFSVNVQHQGVNAELEQVAIASGRHIIALDNPGTGASDKLTLEQRDELKHGYRPDAENDPEAVEYRFSKIADAMLRGLKKQGITEIDIEGRSMGGQLAAAMAARAAEHGITVKTLLLMEPAGLADMGMGELGTNFLIKEGMQSVGEYKKFVTDPRGRETMDSNLDVAKTVVELVRKDVRAVKNYPQAIRHATVPENVAEAMKTQPDMLVSVLTGGGSEIAQREAANAFYEAINEAFPGRIRETRLSGDTHAMDTGNPSRTAFHVARMLENADKS